MVNKSDVVHQLNQQGKWPEAEEWKNQRIRVHRAAGLTKQEARLLAWQETAEKFLPQPVAKPPVEQPPMPVLEAIHVTETPVPDEWEDLPERVGGHRAEMQWLLRNFGLVVCPSDGGFVLRWENAFEPPPGLDTTEMLLEIVSDPYTGYPDIEFFQRFRELIDEFGSDSSESISGEAATTCEL